MKLQDRRPLKVYLDAEDFAKITEKANGQRRAVSDYVRNLVLEDLNGVSKQEQRGSTGAVRVARRRASERARLDSGEVAGRAEQGIAASPVRSFGAGSSKNTERPGQADAGESLGGGSAPAYVQDTIHGNSTGGVFAALPTVADKHSEPRRTGKDVSECVHGTRKGWNCWQCGGIAKVQ